MHIRFGQDTEHVFSTTAALHKQLHSSLVSPQSYLCKFAFHTGLQLPNTDAQQVGQDTEHVFSTTAALHKQLHSSLVSPQSYLCKFAFHTGLQLPNTDADQVLAKTLSMLSQPLLLCTNSFTAALCHHSHTYASLPLVQVCSYPTLMHSRFGQDTEHAFSTTAALHKQLHSSLVSPQSYLCKFAFGTGLHLPNTDADQVLAKTLSMLSQPLLLCTNSFTAALCHHSHTYASLPLVQVCIYPTLMHIRFGQDTEHAFSTTAFSTTAALHKQLHSSLVSPQSHLGKFAFHTGLQLPNTHAQQVWPRH